MTKESQRTEEKKFTPCKENKPQTKLKDKEHIWGNMYNIYTAGKGVLFLRPTASFQNA